MTSMGTMTTGTMTTFLVGPMLATEEEERRKEEEEAPASGTSHQVPDFCVLSRYIALVVVSLQPPSTIFMHACARAADTEVTHAPQEHDLFDKSANARLATRFLNL
ncbi:hypothetical protein B0J11DRAFT_575712 [Dendryphion nanum]|uniref:Uncharacterized protein n=1 Tax=Dendryphion nanum TaxID=256645 RepID=A0A9P9ECH7_9PLEO|nr:hypothetical protein B0J11DRAFT_575712 [Dendryphion nanum]